MLLVYFFTAVIKLSYPFELGPPIPKMLLNNVELIEVTPVAYMYVLQKKLPSKYR